MHRRRKAFLMQAVVWCGLWILLGLPSSEAPAYAADSAAWTVQLTAKNLGALYRNIPASPAAALPSQQKLVLARQLEELLSQLRVLEQIESEIGAVYDQRLREHVLRWRAIAWLHGWAAFSQLVSRYHQMFQDEQRGRLFQLDPSMPQRSALGLLVRSYQHIVAQAGQDPRPLVRGPGTDCGLCLELDYDQQVLPTDAQPQAGGHYIPSTAELLGHPDDSTSPRRNLLSLWAIVNLQLDEWHQLDDRQNFWASDPLVGWLDQLARSPDLGALDPARTLRERVAALVPFLRFRMRIKNPQTLARVVELLTIARITKDLRDTEGAKTDAGQALAELRLAARPIGTERNFEAAIWLRYLFLLTYHDQGLAILFDKGKDKDLDLGVLGDKSAWALIFGADDFLDPLSRPEHVLFRSGMRWNLPPGRLTFAGTLAILTKGTFDYLQAEWNRQQLDLLRIGTQHLSKLRSKYAAQLGAQLQTVQEIERRLSPNLVAAQSTANAGQYAARGAGWRSSATEAEQQRLADDLSILANMTHSVGQLLRSAQAAAISTGPDRNMQALLRALGESAALARWDVSALPSRSFAGYRTEVETALQKITDSKTEQDGQRQAVQEFKAKLETFKDALSSYTTAGINSQLTDSLRALADKEVVVAQLAVSIQTQRELIAQRTVDAASEEAEGADLDLRERQRLRDLGLAELQALNAALDQAQEVVAQAKLELGKKQEELRAAAAQARSDSKRSKLLGAISGIVQIVGLALAPFTGGASLTVAQLANVSLKVASTATDKNRWKDFQSRVGAIVEIANTTAEGVAIGVKAWGTKAEFAEFEKFREQLNKGLSNAQTALAVGKKLYDGVADKRDFASLMALMAAEFPAKLQDGRLVLGKGAQQIMLNLPEGITQQVIALLRNGATLRREAEQVRDQVAQLRAQIDKAFVQLPAEVLAKATGQPAQQWQQAYQTAREQFMAGYAQLPPGEQERVAEVLSLAAARGTAMIVSAEDRIVALGRPLEEEAKELDAEIQSFKQSVLNDTILPIIKTIQEEQLRLGSAQQSAQKDSSGAELDNVANTEIPGCVERISQSLASLNSKIQDKQRDMKSKLAAVDIATHLDKAKKILVEVAQRGSTVASQELEAAKQRLEIELQNQANAILRQRLSELAQSDAERHLQARQQDLVYAFQRALSYGVNPFNGPGSADGEPSARALLHMSTVQEYKQVREAANGLFGMIQWIALLGPIWENQRTLNENSPLAYYNTLVSAVLSAGRGERLLKASAALRALVAPLQARYDELVKKSSFQICAKQEIDGSRLEWNWREGKIKTSFDYRVTVMDADTKAPGFLPVKLLSHPSRRPTFYYARLEADTIESPDSFFLLAEWKTPPTDTIIFQYRVNSPPQGRLSSTSLLETKNPIYASQWKYNQENLMETALAYQVKEDVLGHQEKNPYLLPAAGTWKIEIEYSGATLKLADLKKDPPSFRLVFLCMAVPMQ